MGEIIVQNGCDWNARCKSLVINTLDMTSCASACRDARLVRPLKTLRAFVSTTMLFDFHSPCADARTVRPYMSLACKSFFDIANLKVQCSNFKLQSQPIQKFNGQNSMFKVS